MNLKRANGYKLFPFRSVSIFLSTCVKLSSFLWRVQLASPRTLQLSSFDSTAVEGKLFESTRRKIVFPATMSVLACAASV